MAVTAGYVSVDTFLPEILQYVNGAPSIMVRIHVVNTIILFCERTFVLKKDPTPLSLDEGEHTYTLSFCNDRYRAIACEDVRVGDTENDLPLIRSTEKEMDEENANWRYTENSEPTRYWLTDSVNGIRFYPAPNDDIEDEVNMTCAVTYKRDQLEFDELIYEKWHEAITAGALTELLLIPGASWYNEKLAAAFDLKFRRWVGRARKTTITAPGKYPGRVIPQDFNNIGGSDYRRTTSWV